MADRLMPAARKPKPPKPPTSRASSVKNAKKAAMVSSVREGFARAGQKGSKPNQPISTSSRPQGYKVGKPPYISKEQASEMLKTRAAGRSVAKKTKRK